MSSLEVILAIPLCLQIGEVGTVLLNVPDVDQTIRVSLRDRYAGLPLKAERLSENFKRNDKDKMWPCVLTGSKQPTGEQNQNDSQLGYAQADHVPLNQFPRIEFNQPNKTESNQIAEMQSNEPAQLQSNQAQNQARSNEAQSMHSNHPKDVQSNNEDSTKTDAESNKISAKLIRVV